MPEVAIYFKGLARALACSDGSRNFIPLSNSRCVEATWRAPSTVNCLSRCKDPRNHDLWWNGKLCQSFRAKWRWVSYPWQLCRDWQALCHVGGSLLCLPEDFTLLLIVLACTFTHVHGVFSGLWLREGAGDWVVRGHSDPSLLPSAS